MRLSLSGPRGAALLIVTALAAACGSNQTTGGDNSGTSSGGGGPPLLSPGAACTANSACDSGVCGVNGAGNCCSAACSTTDAACGATSCDNSGTCVYPQPGAPCPGGCVASALTTNACNGNGLCEVQSTFDCPSNLLCGADGGCKTSCASASDCLSGFGCNSSACVRPAATGPCTENDDCISDHCGANGTGSCCRTPCNSYDAPCGANACDPETGACIYPPASTACGSILASCSNGMQQDPTLCDGDGGCNENPTTATCDPFVCGPTACFTGCKDDTSCETGEFCDAAESVCCPDLVFGNKITVDAVSGNDAIACCGMGGHQPCRSLAHALRLIDEAGVQGLTIQATIGKTGGTWAPPNEIYPIVLGWGTTLNASGIFFTDTASPGHEEIFDIRAYSARDTSGKAAIVGTGGAVHIGTDALGVESKDKASIQVEPGNTLYLASVSVNSSSKDKTTAIRVGAGAGLVVGEDQTGFTRGTVVIGKAVGDAGLDGYDGIVCGADAGAGVGCTISDVAVAGASLLIQGQVNVDLDAEDFAAISLASTPAIGMAPTTGFGGCPAKPDVGASNGAAVLLHGKASVSYGGTVQCIAGKGFDLQASPEGVPTLTLTKATIQNTEMALHASAGTATVANSTIQYNFNGVVEDSDGVSPVTIDLSGGLAGGTNTIVCSDSFESVFDAGTGGPGICVRNDTTLPLDADNVAWDTSGPDVFSCDSSLTNCSCDIGSCTADAGDNGMDAVLVEGDAGEGTITTIGNTLSSLQCSVPLPLCGFEQCTDGEICCFQFNEEFCTLPEDCGF